MARKTLITTSSFKLRGKTFTLNTAYFKIYMFTSIDTRTDVQALVLVIII